MKKCFLLSILLFLFAQSYAQDSRLIVFSSDGEPFTLYVNGARINSAPDTQAKASGIKADMVKIRVDFEQAGLEDIVKNVVIQDMETTTPVEVTYEIKKNNKGAFVIRHSSTVDISNEVAQPLILTSPTSVSQTQTTTVTEEVKVAPSVSTTTTSKSDEFSVSMRVNDRDGSVSMSVKLPDDEPASTKPVSVHTQTQQQYVVPAVPNGQACANPTVTNQDFLKVKYEIGQKYLESTKAEDSKKFIAKNCMLASQVAELVQQIKMNNNQIDVAKFGYLYTFDQKNYGLVVDALLADYNKDELVKFIGGNASSSASSTTSTTVTTTSTTTSTSACQPMASSNFSELLEAIGDQYTEENRLSVAKDGVKNECVNANQVSQIMKVFFSESSRLEFAKFAYTRTSDKDKYFRVHDAFFSQNSVKELSNYINSL